MKKLLLLLLCAGFTVTANAQIHKVFLNDVGAPVDSVHASSYILYSKLSDTIWMMKHYKMNGTITMVGTYKDGNLSIQNGEFIYYYKASTKGMKITGKIDTTNYIKTTGYFVNGIKTGVWTDYFSNGHIEYLNTYKNNQLNGLAETYNYDTNTVLIRGYNIDNKNEGEWDMLDPHGNIIEIDIYKNNQVVKSRSISIPYVSPVPPKNFLDGISNSLNSSISSDLKADMLIGFNITTEGKLTDPKIIYGKFSPEIDKKIIDILENSPVWKPAYNKASKQNLQDGAGISIKVEDGKLIVKYLNNDETGGRFYQLTH